MEMSREIRIVSGGDDIDEVLREASLFSEMMHFSKKDALRVRLLTEETISMLRTLTREREVKLSFIAREDGCLIRMEADPIIMDKAMKKDILSVSSTGKNTAVKGIMGKVRDVLENAFMMPEMYSYAAYTSPSMMGMTVDVTSGQLMDAVYWTLADYKGKVETEEDSAKKREQWDELEKSIVSNIADDVQVGVKNGHVVMNIIYKK
ncbi:MAG: hypothetical protein IKO30_00140 [Lachnospiraceae bacterium]|nr:hypothetical protein [Lachnospiraceae bacterium]MBR6896813.1 hypothetical protein [Lachnospiraceae bacterium]